MADRTRDEIRKQLLFLTSEDFNFLTYNVLVLLDTFRAVSDDRPFVDHRKLAYLVDFVANPRLARIVDLYHDSPERLDGASRTLLMRTHEAGFSRQEIVRHLIEAVSLRGYVRTTRTSSSAAMNVWLLRDSLPDGFLGATLFESERINAAHLRSAAPQARRMTLQALLGRLFGEYGVLTCHV